MTEQFLTGRVLVLDGRPRYHLATCRSVRGKDAQPLPVNVARRQGFTPCGSCKPDLVLTATGQAAVPPAAPVAGPAQPALDWGSPPSAPPRDSPPPVRKAGGRRAGQEPARAEDTSVFKAPLRAARRQGRQPAAPRKTALPRAHVDVPDAWQPQRRNRG